jgi:tetratricopeptide (TPR) repeat protein
MLRSSHLWGLVVLTLVLAFAAGAGAQQQDPQTPPQNAAPPRSDTATDTDAPPSEPQAPVLRHGRPGKPPSSTSANPGESSSRSNITDISPPIGDAQEHPDSEVPEELTGTTEMHPWNPHRAEKNVEVGDYYFKRKNYRAAESRYREALYYKENDAMATFRLAQVLDKVGRHDEAREQYLAYLKILPHGPDSIDAHKALERLDAQSKNQAKDSSPSQH